MRGDDANRNGASPESGASDKRISSKKLEANRRNALRSTGPVTPEGKNAVSLNALKHGLCSKEVVILSGEACENPKDYEALLAQLVEDCRPVGSLEEMLVEEIANCWWRLRRLYRTESEVIASRADGERASARRQWERDLIASTFPLGDLEFTRREAGIRELQKILQDAINELRRDGEVYETTCESLAESFGERSEVAYLCRAWFVDSSEDTEELNDKGVAAAPEQPAELQPNKQVAALELLRYELKRLKRFEKDLNEKEKLIFESTKSTPNAPDEDSLNRILRYETSLKRHLYKAMDQLERLQRRRQGEHVPAPVNIEVSGEK